MNGKYYYLKSTLDHKIVLVVRTYCESKIIKMVEAALKGGIKIAEITMTIPNAIRIIESLVEKFGDSAIFGAGTVLDAKTARLSMLAGAQFIVSPCIDIDTIKMCKRYSKIVIPGAMTPNEILKAWEEGADIVKVFPIDNLGGSDYIKSLKGPFPQILLNPSGNININNAQNYIAAGASVISVGSAILDKKAIESNHYEIITNKAKEFVKIIKQINK